MKRFIFVLFLCSLFLCSFVLFTSTSSAQTPSPTPDSSTWYMAGANPQRTSWVSSTAINQTEITGNLKPLWYKPIEAYISQKVQIIASNDTLFVATSRGLYALDLSGNQKWVYPTELPLGHSPTVVDGVVYVGGFDRKIHAISINQPTATVQALWTFEAGAGFQTNPLVVNNVLYAGSRDGYMYALDVSDPNNANKNRLKWTFPNKQAGQPPLPGPILYSAAASLDNQTIYFAADDSRAYAVHAQTGQSLWFHIENGVQKPGTDKLPGSGFHSWWPVVYQDRVVFSGSSNYRNVYYSLQGNTLKKEPDGLVHRQGQDVFYDAASVPHATILGPLGIEPGKWVDKTVTIDASRIQDYYEQKPHRRSYFVLDRLTGKQAEIAPVLWTGSHGVGTRMPPVVSQDGVLYQHNTYLSNPSIPGGNISGWKIGTPYISAISGIYIATDEPISISSGGNLIYWNHCCDRATGAIDISQPFLRYDPSWVGTKLFPSGFNVPNRTFGYYSYDELLTLIRGYSAYYNIDKQVVSAPWPTFGRNGIYSLHNDQNSPIPYKGKLYLHRGNSVIALARPSTTGQSPTPSPASLPKAAIVSTTSSISSPTLTQMKAILKEEINKILSAGHLKPGYHSAGLFDGKGADLFCGDDVIDYFHQPAETVYTLMRAYPHVPELQTQIESYLNQHYMNSTAPFKPYQINHSGWKDGAAREIVDLPPEVVTNLQLYTPRQTTNASPNDPSSPQQFLWKKNPFLYYSLYLYAKQFGGASALYTASKQVFLDEFNRQYTNKDRVFTAAELAANPPILKLPSDQMLLRNPHVHNAYIAGYTGFLELEKLAGQPETTSPPIRQELTRLKQLRATSFTKDSAYPDVPPGHPERYCQILSISNNFMYMVPELSEYLRANALSKVQAAVEEYEVIAPYWFVSFPNEAYGENYSAVLYDTHGLFQAKAKILKEPYSELSKYIDVPGFYRGDLYYIDNLVSALEADGTEGIVGDVDGNGTVTIDDLKIALSNLGKSFTSLSQGDVTRDNKVNMLDSVLILENLP